MSHREGDGAVIAGIGDAIRELRRRRELSTRALARLAGVSQPLLSSIENGRTQPSVPSLYAIAEALGVGPSALLPAAEGTVVGSAHGMPLAPGDAPVTLTLLHAAPAHAIEAYRVELAAGHRDEHPFQHAGEDLIHVLGGAVVLECGRATMRLEAGDTVLIDGTTPHSFATGAQSSAVVLVATVR
jgi:transcriptional regulator with XRE-family HTH domain